MNEGPAQMTPPRPEDVEPVETAPPRTALGLFVAVVAFVLPIAYSPTLNAPFWSARLAVVLLVIAVGLPRLAALAAQGDKAAGLATAFLAVATVSALAARQPVAAVFGPYGFGAGLFMVAAMVAAWALGRSLDATGRADVRRAILAALLVNIVVAIAQEVLDLRSLGLSTFQGAYGLLGNPVHLGALLAGGIGLLAAAFRSRPGPWAPWVVAAGAALQLSGSRFGLLALTAMTACAVWRWPPARRAALVGCLAAGFVGALLVGPALPDHSDSPTVVQKLQAAGERDLYNRVENWRSGARALSGRPVLGYGPGRFLEATSPRRTARMAAGDPEAVFFDAHNLFVEYLVTTGPVGLLALVGFLRLTRPARGPLLWCALGILALHLVQPQSFGTTPVALLALGAAGPPGPASRHRQAVLATTAALVVVALVGAGRLLLGDFRLDQANLDFSTAQGRAAAGALEPWPEPASKLGEIFFFRSATEAPDQSGRRELHRQSLGWLREAVDRDPARATGWNNLADVQLAVGRREEARRAFTEALERNPWSARALTALAAIALDDGDDASARSLVGRAEQVLSRDAVSELVEKRRR